MMRVSFSIFLSVLCSVLTQTGHTQSPKHKTTTCQFDRQAKNRHSRKKEFFGTWADYFSSFLTINTDSTFTYTRSFQDNPTFISGTWKRNEDTFYFKRANDEETIKSFNTNLMIWPVELPEKLCYFRDRLFHIDPKGELMRQKVLSPFSIIKNVAFKTLYYRNKKYNLNYFDSSYYHKAISRRFTMGAGINMMFIKVSNNPIVGSFGFTFSPRYIFKKTPNSFLSLGVPFTIGFSDAKTYTNGVLDENPPIFGILIDLPLILNYNHDWGSALTAGSRFGYFAGAGFAYHLNDYSVSKGTVTMIEQLTGFGPVFNAGMRYSFTRYRVTNIELKFACLKMIVSSRPNIYGISLLINM